MMKSPILQGHIVPFVLGNLEAITSEAAMFVSVRHLCEAFKLDFSSQRKKLLSDPKFNCGDNTTVAADGKRRELLTIPLEQVSGFLYSINSNRVKPEVRQMLLDYQDECTKALYAYWTTGKAEQQTATAQMAFQVADTLAVFKEEYATIYGKPADAEPHSGLYAKIQETLNLAVYGVKKLPDLPRTELPKIAAERLKTAAQMLRKAFIRGEKVSQAAKQIREAFPLPVLSVEIKVAVIE